MRIRILLSFAIISILLFMNCENQAEDIWIISAPAERQYTSIDRSGTTIIPNGRQLTPKGHQIEVAPHPYGLTLSPDGSVAVTANSGVRPFSISIIRDVTGKNPSVQQVPPEAQTDKGILAAEGVDIDGLKVPGLGDPNEWTETNVAASYGGGRRQNLDSKAPGMLALTGSSGVPIPEDYTEAGTIWDHLDRNGIDFFNFGLGFDFAPNIEKPEFKYTVLRFVINYPMTAPLFEKTSKIFAAYNMGIPDQFRVKMFKQEFEEKWLSKDEPFPPFIVIYLPNDHGAGEFPELDNPAVMQKWMEEERKKGGHRNVN